MNPKRVPWLFIARAGLACLLVLICLGSKPLETTQALYWPYSSPEAQGMDSNDLIGLLDWIEIAQLDVHSILVMRHGNVVMEVYYPPNLPTDKHLQFSISKSFTSALIGIAIGEGKIQSVNEPVISYFSDLSIANLNNKKKSIRILDLLMMNSGLVEDNYAMSKAADKTQYCIDLPVKKQPGTTFEYTNCNVLLLSAILQKATGKSAAEYGREKLFDPLGIKDFYWQADATGVSLGYSGLMLNTPDLLKFGILYNQKGIWEGKQIIPADWIAASYTMYEQGYGYLWWQGLDGLGASGYAGQRMFVFPQQDIVIAVTGNLLTDWEANGVVLTPLFAIRSDGPLPESDASHQLAERIYAIEHPVAQPVPQLPAMAPVIHGKTFRLDANPLGWETARLEFNDNSANLFVTSQTTANVRKFVIGLDGVYRRTKQAAISVPAVPEPDQRWNQNPFAFAFLLGAPVDGMVWMKGAWAGEDHFVLTVRDSRNFDRETLTFHFASPSVSIDWHSLNQQSNLIILQGTMKK